MNSACYRHTEQVLKFVPRERRLKTELLSWMTQDKLSLLKFERRPIWQKKTAIAP